MNESGIVLGPVEGKWFQVNPEKLDFSFFEKPIRNIKQEEIRLLILEAKNELLSKQEKYMRPFCTLIPSLDLSFGKSILDLKLYSKKRGDCMANWVEQCLEWVQRVNNGESWNKICIMPDNTRNYRLVEWKNGSIRFFGGSSRSQIRYPATTIGKTDWGPKEKVYQAVPLIVKYK